MSPGESANSGSALGIISKVLSVAPLSGCPIAFISVPMECHNASELLAVQVSLPTGIALGQLIRTTSMPRTTFSHATTALVMHRSGPRAAGRPAGRVASWRHVGAALIRTPDLQYKETPL